MPGAIIYVYDSLPMVNHYGLLHEWAGWLVTRAGKMELSCKLFFHIITVKPDVLLMGTLQTFAATLVFWLTVWVEQVATCASKLLSLPCRFQKSFGKQFATRNSYCGFWWLTYIKIVSRGWKREKITDLWTSVQFKTNTNRRRSWIIASNGI